MYADERDVAYVYNIGVIIKNNKIIYNKIIIIKNNRKDIFGKYQLVALLFSVLYTLLYVGKRTYLNYRRWYFSCKLQSKCFHRYTRRTMLKTIIIRYVIFSVGSSRDASLYIHNNNNILICRSKHKHIYCVGICLCAYTA